MALQGYTSWSLKHHLKLGLLVDVVAIAVFLRLSNSLWKLYICVCTQLIYELSIPSRKTKNAPKFSF